jgi:hypothetical protein
MSEPTSDGRLRVVITRLSPEIDCGRFATKRVISEKVVVEAYVFTDGHDQVACQLVYWHDGNESVSRTRDGDWKPKKAILTRRTGCAHRRE